MLRNTSGEARQAVCDMKYGDFDIPFPQISVLRTLSGTLYDAIETAIDVDSGRAEPKEEKGRDTRIG